jgi:GTP-sensing pleiotropic transcriptional regulator CodY
MALVICIQASVNPKDAAHAAATYTFVRTTGRCVGVAMGGSIFQNAFSHYVHDLALPTSLSNNAEAVAATLKSLKHDSLLYQAYVMAYSQSFTRLFIAMTAIVGVGGLSSLLVQKFTMNKKLESEHVIQK